MTTLLKTPLGPPIIHWRSQGLNLGGGGKIYMPFLVRALQIHQNALSRVLGRGLKKNYNHKKSPFLSRLMLLDRKNIYVKRCTVYANVFVFIIKRMNLTWLPTLKSVMTARKFKFKSRQRRLQLLLIHRRDGYNLFTHRNPPQGGGQSLPLPPPTLGYVSAIIYTFCLARTKNFFILKARS